MAKEQVSSILRALRILECFMDRETEWTLKELVEYLDLPTTTVFRQVSTLTERQYLIQDPVRKSYRVGPRLMLLASAILGQSDLRQVAGRSWSTSAPPFGRPSISASCWNGISSIWIRSRPTVPSFATPRSAAAPRAYATSSGKVMLAGQDPAYIDDYCAWMRHKAMPLTKKTITDPDLLRLQLNEARLKGYAMDDGEIEEGLICVAAPIYDLNRHIIGAVSISGPDYRMEKDQDVMISSVRNTASNISRLLGYRV